jgi:deazaflavin-dependent oxidoreductase (nitroreductase family)
MANRSGGIGKSMGRGVMRTWVWLFRRSGGKIGGSMRGAPLLLLTTTGRKSGRPWTVPVMYQPADGGWVVIASNGGAPTHPSWWLNLRSNPDARIEIGRDAHQVTATEATGDDRERLWRVMTSVNSGFDGYTKKTTRTLPVVMLRPR